MVGIHANTQEVSNELEAVQITVAPTQGQAPPWWLCAPPATTVEVHDPAGAFMGTYAPYSLYKSLSFSYIQVPVHQVQVQYLEGQQG